MRRLCTTLAFILFAAQLEAGLITQTLGNGTPAFADGDTLTIFDLIAAHGGQTPPFDAGIGNELFEPSFSADWTFTYGIAEPILSASIVIGIADHDSAASGSQLASFGFDGNDLSGDLDTLFEASSSGDQVYNVYTIALQPLLFPSLADGSATFSLALSGPGLVPVLLGGGVSESPSNGAFLIFSTVSITTEDTTPPPGVPEPATTWLLGTWLVGLLGARRYLSR